MDGKSFSYEIINWIGDSDKLLSFKDIFVQVTLKK